MDELGRMEDEIFRRRHQNEVSFKAREKAKKQQKVNFELLEKTQFAPMVRKKIVILNKTNTLFYLVQYLF